MARSSVPLAAVALVGLLPLATQATEGAHADPVVPAIVGLAVVLVAALLGGEAAVRLRQPRVLGEVLAGVVLGNLVPLFPALPDPGREPSLDLLARLGVVVLLFEVGLESTVSQMVAVGARATLVAVVGVVAPIAGGFLAGEVLMPDEPSVKHLFLGAALCATSVGITARVFQELNVSKSSEARLVLGAAVIDDVLGLVVLTLASGLALASGGAGFSWQVPARVVALSTVFLVGALLLGPRVSRGMFRLTTRMRSPHVLLPAAFAFAFAVSALANAVELAPIVGAYAAGLVLEEAHYRTLLDRGEQSLESLVHPVSQLLVPVFFVVMGARVRLADFAGGSFWLLAGMLIVVAVAAKLVCGLCAAKGMNRLAIGFGMVPRGEVGLIFADAGRRLVVDGKPLLTGGDYSAVVLMVMATTMAAPPLLGWALRRGAGRSFLRPRPGS